MKDPKNGIPEDRTNVKGFWRRQRILLKGFFIGFLVLMLLIPTLFIARLIEERSDRSEEVKAEIAAQWGGRQEISGPILSISYLQSKRDQDDKIRSAKKYAFFLPEKIDIVGSIHPEVKHRSIFEMVGYNADLQVSGSFAKLDLYKLKIPKESILFEESQILFGLSDFKGIKEELLLEVGGNSLILDAGVPANGIVRNGLNAPLILTSDSLAETIPFSMDLQIRGSEGLFFLPLGKTTNVKLTAEWANPSFEGISPSSSLTDSSFVADWSLLSINRAYPQEWSGNDNYDVRSSSFGVNLLDPINHYRKNMRSVKYAILVILLSFVIYFFVEIFQQKNAHAIQYVLVGFALCMFYTLLLSFSEIVGFNWAYFIASGATIGLIGAYTTSIFRSIKVGSLFSGYLVGLYFFIFLLIQLQDKALLFGSIGLFIILGIIMFVSRKINWHEL